MVVIARPQNDLSFLFFFVLRLSFSFFLLQETEWDGWDAGALRRPFAGKPEWVRRRTCRADDAVYHSTRTYNVMPFGVVQIEPKGSLRYRNVSHYVIAMLRCLRFAEFCWVGLENTYLVDITMKPTNSPTQGQPNPRKIRSKVALGPIFLPQQIIFRGLGLIFV